MNTTVQNTLVDHLPRIRGIIKKISVNGEAIDDASQEVCVRIIEKEGLWRGDVNTLKQWMNTITRNVMRRKITKLKSKKNTTQRLVEDPPERIFDEAFSEEQMKWVVQQFKTLPEKQQNVLAMRYFQSMKVSEIAKVLGVSQSTASHHIASGISQLKKKARAEGILMAMIPWSWNFKAISKAVIANKLKCAAVVVFATSGATAYNLTKNVETPRVIVNQGEEQIYKVTGNNFIFMTSRLRLNEKYFGKNVTLSPNALGGNHPNSLSKQLPMGFEFAFMHPKSLGYTKKSEKKSFKLWSGLQANNTLLQYLEFDVTAKKFDDDSWKYQCRLAASSKNTEILHTAVGQNKIKIEDVTIDIKVEFNEKLNHVDNAELTYSWKLDKPYNKYPNTSLEDRVKLISKKNGAGKKRKPKDIPENKRVARETIKLKNEKPDIYTVNIKFEKKSQIPQSYEAKVDRAINMSVDNIWGWVKDTMVAYEKMPEKDQNKLYASATRELGQMALAIFALLRSDVDPTRPDVEQLLIDFSNLSKLYYKIHNNQVPGIAGRPPYAGYVSPLILMAIESAVTFPEEEKSVIQGKNDSDKKKKKKKEKNIKANGVTYRGSKRLLNALLPLAQDIVYLLTRKAGPIVFKKAKKRRKYIEIDFLEPIENSRRGHVWSYTGMRDWYYGSPETQSSHFSPSQYAVLALRSAKLMGLHVPEDVWEDLIKGVIQDKMEYPSNGVKFALNMTFKGEPFWKSKYRSLKPNAMWGWQYNYAQKLHEQKDKKGNEVKYIMHCAGLGNLVMAYGYRWKQERKNKELKQTLLNGLLFFQEKMPKYDSAPPYYYLLYSMERVCVFFGIEKINGVDWHKYFSEKIMAQQMMSGEFAVQNIQSDYYIKSNHYCPQAFALLFLKKGTKKLKKYTVGTR